MQDEQKRQVLNRLKSIEGHVRGIQRMLEEDVYCIDIMNQNLAVQRALEKVKAQVVDEKKLQMFDLYAVRKWPARKVARSLGVSLAKVYFNKHYISKLLHREIQRLQGK